MTWVLDCSPQQPLASLWKFSFRLCYYLVLNADECSAPLILGRDQTHGTLHKNLCGTWGQSGSGRNRKMSASVGKQTLD